MPLAELLGREPPSHAHIYRDGDVAAAVMPITRTQWECHIGVAPGERGKVAQLAFRALIEQFWRDHPEAEELVGVMEASHRAARMNAARLGFERFLTHDIEWPDGVVRETVCYRLGRH